jgi:hypothetical protein
MDTRQRGASPAVATRRHLPRLHPARAAAGGPAGPGGPKAAGIAGHGWPAGLAPPVTALTASRAPSHATSAAS